MKNSPSVLNLWGGALKDARKYIAQNAQDVVIQLPQIGKPGNPLPSAQQLQNLQNIKNDHPTVKLTIVIAEPTEQKSLDALKKLVQKFPEIHFETIPSTSPIPYEPPPDDWGNQIP